MHYFLQEAARDIYQKHGEKLSELCLVFPNRRSGVYFRRYLAKNIRQPVWSPQILTISDLMQQFSGYQLADNLKLIFDLHQVFNREQKKHEPFDEFYFWGEMLLHDFDDIDKYLVNPRDIFQNLASLKSIDDKFTYLSEDQIKVIRRFWDSLRVDQLSNEQKDFLNIWEILYNVYFQLNQQLDDKQYAYEGKIYRSVNDLIKAGKLEAEKEKYVFIGFNALTPCEKELFRHLKNNDKAEFYWDYDESYLEKHEAGQFMRENLKEFPGALDTKPVYLNSGKQIEFVNTSYDIAQAKILPDLLKEEIIPADNPNKLAVILPDEHLLQPVLNSLPAHFEGINVTMGYPVAVTPAYSLLLSLIQLQQNAKEGERTSFYHKDVLALLNHQYIGMIRDDKTEAMMVEIKKHNKVFVSEDELRVNHFMRNLFVLQNTYQSMSDYLMDNYFQFYRILKEQSGEDKSVQLELECIYHVYLTIKQLREVFEEQGIEVKTETYRRILERVIQNQTIPYQGEPLSGLQVMGILETRTLDFDHLVVLSMNEGTFPKADSTPSFIPYSLRKGFGLPTYEHNDAIYAYYFYRMIQRSQKVTMVYNSSSSGLQTGEMSRFMKQLKYEWDIPVKEKTVVSDISTPEIQEIRVPKDQEVLRKLEDFNSLAGEKRTLSPSALNKFLSCPLQFYFRYIAGLKEPDEITENVDLPLFGSLLHKALELIYKPHVGKEVSAELLNKLAKDNQYLNQVLDDAFREEYFTSHPKDKPLKLTGKNILIKEILHRYIRQFLKVDQKFSPFTVKALENTYSAQIKFEAEGKTKQVTFKGIIDRLDENREGIRVIDYKTGKSEQTMKSVESLFSAEGNHKALQALVYSKMFADSKGDGRQIIPGLYFIRDLFVSNFTYGLKMGREQITYQLVEREFEQHLKSTLQDLFDPSQDFYQTEDEDICRNCPYKDICRR